MSLLNVSNLSKYFGTDLIFESVSFEVEDSDKIGFVGVNGSGKSTLFKVLMDELPHDDGQIFWSKNATIGYVEQHVCKNLEISVYKEVLSVFEPLMKIERQLELITTKLQAITQNYSDSSESEMNKLIEEQSFLHESFERNGGLTYANRTRSTLMGLGFTNEQLNLPVGVMSGGQKAKLQLAKMLLSNANLLLLDEPTNHLDIKAVEWLEDFLKSYNGAFIVISHDRYFLDKVTQRTFEMSNHRVNLYKGNYSKYLILKEEAQLTVQRQFDRTQKEIDRIEGIITQQKRFNRERNYITIASKQKSIDRLEETLERPDEKPDDINFDFSIKRGGSNDVLDVKDLSLTFDVDPLFKNANIEIKKGDRVFLIGANGCGKTSLFKCIVGQYEPTLGSIKVGPSIDLGYYDQTQAGLDDKKLVIDEVWDEYPNMNQTEIRSALAVFLFKNEEVFKNISSLSGGERARVLMLKLMLEKNNFLLLDEPTNHLDIASREALENALLNYDGTLFIVSHDRYLINKLATKVYYLNKDCTTKFDGNYDDYIEKINQQKELEPTVVAPKGNDYKAKKEQQALVRKIKNQISKAEAKIEENDQAIAELEAMFELEEISTSFEKTVEVTDKINLLKEENEKLYESWEEASSKLEELE